MSDPASRPSDAQIPRAVNAAPPSGPTPEMRQHLEALASPSPAARAEALAALPKFGATAASAIVQAMRRRAAHPEEMPEFVDALAAVGRAGTPALTDAIDHTEDVGKPEALTLLLHLLTAAGRIDDKQFVPSVTGLLKRLRPLFGNGTPAPLQDQGEHVRIKAHEVLSELGDTSGLDDLLKMLGDGTKRVRLGIVHAVGRISDRRALVPLLRLHEIELPVSSALAQDVKNAFRDILKRHNVAPDDPTFGKLKDTERPALERLHPGLKKATNGRH